MSGWEKDYSCAAFGLTATKANYWHRGCECGAQGLEQIWTAHLEPRGFIRLEPSPSRSLLVITRDDLDAPVSGTPAFSEGPIFEAVKFAPAEKG